MRLETTLFGLLAVACSAIALLTWYGSRRNLVPRYWVVAALTLLALPALGFGPLIGIGRLVEHRTISAIVMMFAMIVLPITLFTAAAAVPRKLGERRPLKGFSPSRFTDALFMPKDTALTSPQAKLGRPSRQISVTTSSKEVTIVLSARRTTGGWVRGILLMSPLLFVAYYAAALVYVGFGMFGEVGPTQAIVPLLLGLVTFPFRFLPFGLAIAYGTYSLFGKDVITLSQTQARLRKVVFRGIGFTFRTLTFSPRESLEIDVRPDALRRLSVRVKRQGTIHRRWDREFEFGAGLISQSQADSLAEHIETWLGERHPALVSEKSQTKQVAEEVV